MKELVEEEGVVDGVEGLREINGEKCSALVRLLVVKPALNFKGDGKKCSVAGMQRPEALLVGILGKGVKEGEDEGFKNLHGGAEERDGW